MFHSSSSHLSCFFDAMCPNLLHIHFVTPQKGDTPLHKTQSKISTPKPSELSPSFPFLIEVPVGSKVHNLFHFTVVWPTRYHFCQYSNPSSAFSKTSSLSPLSPSIPITTFLSNPLSTTSPWILYTYTYSAELAKLSSFPPLILFIILFFTSFSFELFILSSKLQCQSSVCLLAMLDYWD